MEEQSKAQIRKIWLDAEIQEVKNDQPMRMCCVMGTPDRIELGICDVNIPAKRMKRGFNTCSIECQNDKNRLLRWEQSKGKCRMCGHGLSSAELKKRKTNGKKTD